MIGAGRANGVPVAYGGLDWGVLVGATIVFLTGLLDDLRGVPPSMKIVAQTAAALIVVGYGFDLQRILVSPGGVVLSLGFVGTVVSVLWIVGMTNAFNLIDGADGLAGTFALIALAAIVAANLFVLGNGSGTMVVSFAMIGAVLGFLHFNRAPARIFLGDSGSMTLGFILAIQIVRAATDSQGRTFVLVPLFTLAFPVLDTLIAIARRWIRGHPLSRADGRHIHHQLLALGLSVRAVVSLLGLLFLAVAILGFSTSFAPARFTFAFLVATGSLIFVTAVYGTRLLGYTEFSELGRSVGSVLLNARMVVREKLQSAELAAEIKNAKDFAEVRALLDAFIEEARILDLDLFATHQAPHGPTRQQISPADQLPIRLEYPFVWNGPDGPREIVVRLWSERPREGAHPSTERIASRLGPAIEAWCRTHEAEARELFSDESSELIHRRSSGASRRSDP